MQCHPSSLRQHSSLSYKQGKGVGVVSLLLPSTGVQAVAEHPQESRLGQRTVEGGHH